MPSYTVNTAADSGTGSLRQAILDANIAGGSSTITFAASVGTITLASALPVLKASVSIDGSGASGGHLAIDGAGLYRIFFAGDGNAISLDLLHLTLQNGRAKGGNGGDGGGGGMGAGAGLFLNQNVGANLTDVQFVNNAAVGGNGSVWTSTGYGGGGGGLGGNADVLLNVIEVTPLITLTVIVSVSPPSEAAAVITVEPSLCV
ncbi:MAG: rsaA, partial [Rhodospirillales bacterium]|nr:rsaA [Rhodospirillales bacterium]